MLDLDPLRIANLQGIGNGYVNDLEWLDNNTLALIVDDMLGGMALVRYDLVKDERVVIASHKDVFSTSWTADIFPPYTFGDGRVLYMLKSSFGIQRLHYWYPANGDTERITTFTHGEDMVIPSTSAGEWLMEEWVGLEYKVTYSNNNETENKIPSKRETLFSGSYLDWNRARPLAMEAGARRAYMATSDGKKHEIKLYDLDQREFVSTVLSDEKYDVQAEPLVEEHTGNIIGFIYDRGRPTVVYVDKQFENLMKRFDLTFPENVNVPVSISEDGNRIIVWSFSSRNPGEYFLFDVKENRAEPLLARADWLDEKQLSVKEVVTYQARDGLEIEAYFTRPRVESSNKPLIIMPHGGPHVRDTWHFDSEVQFLASLGYAVLQPNYRLSLGYGQDHFRKGLQEVGHKVQDDLFDAIKWAKEQGYGKDSEVCIMGGSFGGYAAMRAATLAPDAFKCVIATAGLYDLLAQLKDDEEHPGYEILTMMYGDPGVDAERERLQEASPLHDVEVLKAPVLVLHGERDERVSVLQATRLIDALEAEGKVYEAMIRRDEGHGFIKVSNRKRALEKIGAFLQRYLPIRSGEIQKGTAAGAAP